MARKLEPEEERGFFEALAQECTESGDPVLSRACLRRKEDAPLPLNSELAAWVFEQKSDRFPF